MKEIALRVNRLTVAYHDSVALKNACLAIPKGEVAALIGPNGAGKSTLLKACMGLLPPLAGEVYFFDQPLSQSRKLVGYMPQAAEVDWDFPTTVIDTVMMGAYGRYGWFKRLGRQAKIEAMAALERVGIPQLANRQISELSGGQKQRTFMARILMQDPQIYIMDEPFAGVDAASEQALIQVLNELRNAGKTVIIVHHDLSTIKQFCSWVVLLSAGQVLASGKLEDAFRAQMVAQAYGIDNAIFN